MTLTGYKELDAVFKALPRSMDHKTWSAINYDRSKIIVQRMKGNAPVGATHNLVDSIGSVKLSQKQTELGAVRSGPRRTKKFKGSIGAIVTYGTKRRRTKSGANRGVMPKNNFLEKSWDQVKSAVETGLADSARKVIVRTAKRFLK